VTSQSQTESRWKLHGRLAQRRSQKL
jgi:hypothetical protein